MIYSIFTYLPPLFQGLKFSFLGDLFAFDSEILGTGEVITTENFFPAREVRYSFELSKPLDT